MDFIRYSVQSETWAVQDVSIERSLATHRRYLRIGDTNIPMSTGLRNGDGYQASHFLNADAGEQPFGIMDPTIAVGETLGISDNDLLVFDAIGWDIVAVPEPASLALAVVGISWQDCRVGAPSHARNARSSSQAIDNPQPPAADRRRYPVTECGSRLSRQTLIPHR